MTPIEDLKIEAQIELGGTLFATVKASFLDGARLVGAHVDLDGNVLGDTGLIPSRVELRAYDLDERFQAIRALRQVASVAVMNAHRECGMAFELADSRAVLSVLARALPYPEIDEDEDEMEGEEENACSDDEI